MIRMYWLFAALGLLLAGSLFGQSTRPQIDEEDLIKGIRAGLGTEELIRYVENRGVDFLLTPYNRKRLTDARATAKLIDAIEASIRQQVGVKCPEVKAPEPVKCPEAPAPPVFTPTAGAALSRSELVLLLHAGVPVANVLKLVETRGVSFQSSVESAREIRASGGNAELNGVISENYKAPPPPPEPPPAPAPVAVKQPAAPSNPVTAPAPRPETTGVPVTLSVDWSVQRTKATKTVNPVYPEQARTFKSHGLVSVSILISKDGRVRSATALSGPDALRQASVDAARRWEFHPTLINGAPVEVKTEIPFSFAAP